jgi:peptide/nickel transport system permease protein
MARYLAQKLASLIAVQFGITLIVFFMIRLVPGDVVDFLYAQYMSKQRADEIRVLFGLDRPAIVQYADWLWNLLHGDLGTSMLSGRPILGDILLRFPTTAELALYSLLWSVPLGVACGVIAARRPYGKVDGLVTSLSLIGLATPSFWSATLLVLFLAVYLGWFPAVGFVSFTENPLGNVRSLVLPALALGTTMAAAVMRMTRAAMLDVLKHDYIRTARAKGMTEQLLLSRHALRNALIPVLTLIGTETGKLLGGSLIIEQIFAIPGIGQYAVNSIFTRDYPVLQAAILFIASSYVILNTLVDVSYAAIDPRVKFG